MTLKALVPPWPCVIAGVVAIGCVAMDGEGGKSIVRDSLGVQIVENISPASAQAPFTLDSAPVIDLGRVSGRAHEEFSGFVFPVRLSDGRLVVANSGSHELRVFDSRGTWQKSIGRSGDGPGEFRSLAWLHVGVGDTLRTYDWSLLRVSVFSPDGTFQRSTWLGVPGEQAGLRPLGVLADGRLVARTQNAVTTTSRAGVHRDTVSVVVYDALGQVSGSVGRYPGHEDWIVRGEKRVSVSDRPFGKNLFAVAHQLLVVVGTADRPEVLVKQADGKLKRVVRWTATPLPVTAADIDAYVKRAGAGWEPGSEARRNRYLETLKDAPYPSMKPAYAGILVSADGSLWIRRYSEPAHPDDATFEVFDSSGTWQGAVQMPARFTPTQITPEYAIGTWMDTDDVQHVRVYGFISRH